MPHPRLIINLAMSILSSWPLCFSLSKTIVALTRAGALVRDQGFYLSISTYLSYAVLTRA